MLGYDTHYSPVDHDGTLDRDDPLDGIDDLMLGLESLDDDLETVKQAKRELRARRCGAQIVTPNSQFCYQCGLTATCNWCRWKLGQKWAGWAQQALDRTPVYRITMTAREFQSFSRKYAKDNYLAIPQLDDWYMVLHNVEAASGISITLTRESIATLDWALIAGDKHATGKRVSGNLGKLAPVNNGEVAFKSVGVGVVASCPIPRTETSLAIKALQATYTALLDKVASVTQAELLANQFELDYVKSMDSLKVPESDRIVLHVWGHVVLQVKESILQEFNSLNDTGAIYPVFTTAQHTLDYTS